MSFGHIHYFIEIKRDAKAEYTAAQVRFQRTHPHAVLRCDSVAQAAELCAMIRRLARAWVASQQ